MKTEKSHLFQLSAGALLALSTVLVAHADPSGLWKWSTPGRNGGPERFFNLRLKTDGDQLTGFLITPNRTNETFSEIPITDAHRTGDDVSFSVVRNNNGNLLVAKYSGHVEGDKLVGTIEASGRNGSANSNAWKAERNTSGKLVSGPVVEIKPGYDENGHKIVNETHYKEVSVTDAEQLLKTHPEAVILDLRTPEEYAAGHLPNAKNYDVTDETKYKNVLAPLDKARFYVVHSAVGHYRTVRALEYFEANGFQNAVAIDGGYKAWADAGKPVIKN